MTLKVYLAARYSRHPEMQAYATVLREAGDEITSRWINGSHQVLDGQLIGTELEASVESGNHGTVSQRMRFATEDWNDLTSADIVINFTEQPRSANSRGGRHVEFGAALALGLRCIIVGPRENVFHCLPEVEQFDTWSDAYDALPRLVPA